MAHDAPPPLVFLDVDGPVLPFTEAPDAEPWDDAMDAQSARLNHSLGLRLAALPCQLVWATAWEEDANAEISPRIGLPQLPMVIWPKSSDEREREDTWFGLHWKTRALVEWAAGRDFAWVDDEVTDADREWVSQNHSGRVLLHRVDPSRGLSDEDFATLDGWLRAG